MRHDHFKRPIGACRLILFLLCSHIFRLACGAIAFSGQPSFKHGLPVPVGRRQSEQAVQPHVVNQHASVFTRCLPQPASHLLQVFGQRKGRAGHLYELHVRAVEALAEHIHIHQHLRLAPLKVFDKLFAQTCRSLAVNRHGVYSMHPVEIGNIPCMADADGIHDAFLLVGILPYAFVQLFDAGSAVQHLVHFFRLEITVRSTFRQVVYQSLGFAARADGYVVSRQGVAVKPNFFASG